jgi:hypothetical protein
MSSLGIFSIGLIVCALTGFGAYLIGLQEDDDRRGRTT